MEALERSNVAMHIKNFCSCQSQPVDIDQVLEVTSTGVHLMFALEVDSVVVFSRRERTVKL